ncbi:MAG: phage tail tape measure protein [Pseudomonadota bacterium]
MNEDDIFRERGAVDDLTSAYERLGEASGGAMQGLSFDLRASTEQIRRMESEAGALSRSIGSGLRRAFDGAIFSGKKLSDVFSDLALSMARSALSSAVSPLQNALGGAVTSLFSGFADGGAFSAGRVRAFAKGGVVSGPTTFPMRGGMGLMGEAGPEAIMPLTRGADGSLGVRAAGGRSGNVTVNISTPDAESFRRSQGQVAAGIARAVRRGERNM